MLNLDLFSNTDQVSQTELALAYRDLKFESVELPQTKRVITIRHNLDYSHDQVEVLDGTLQVNLYDFDEVDPLKLAEILRWFGHTVRVVDYMFEHDIKEFDL